MKLLVGLGNPGQKYASNRHNIGFVVVDEIVRRYGLAGPRLRFQSEAFEGMIGGERVLALKPTTFMNESGRAVSEAMRFFKLEPSDVIVIHDEIDLAPAKLKFKIGGGTAGHNGLRSIDRHIGPEFVRARIGVGHPGRKDQVYSHVLKDFSKADREWVEPTVSALAEHVELLLKGDLAGYANKVHLTLHPREEQKPDKKDKPDGNDGVKPSPEATQDKK